MLKKSLLTLLLLFVWFNFGYAGYPYDSVCPNPAGGSYSQEDIDQWNFYKCECTSYAAYRLNAISPIGFDNGYQGVGWHDGGHWGYAADQAGIARNKNPLPGDIAWWDSGGSGHVAFVEKVNYDGEGKATSVDITEYNVPIYSYDYNSRTISVNDPDDYIHFLSHEYDGVACAPHSNGKELCWSYNNNISCSSGEGHFYNDKDGGICYMASASDCSGTIGFSKYVGGRGGGVIGILKGPGYETIPIDTPDPGFPDFIVKKVELSNYNPKKTDEIKMRAQLKNIGDDDISGDDDIETRYYLSKGYKEDSHSDWIRVGKDNTKGRNLDPDETHWEEEGLKLWDYSVIEPGKTYNVVVCVDRTKDKDNGDGDYPEIHKSNNCSTEAVLTVQSTIPPSPTGKFVWSSAGTVSGYQCTQILEPSDFHTWNDNYFCSDNNYGIAWSYNGTISNMRCTLVRESADGSYWDDNYICVPTASDIYFSWSSAGPITGKACVKWSEPADPDTWDDNYLCYEIKTTTPPPPPPEYNLQIISMGFSVQDRPKLWPGKLFDVSATAYNAGDNLLSSVSIGYYLDDALIASHNISASSLTNGIYFSDSLNGITAPTEPGNHSAKVCIDYDNRFQEVDETDNCQSISVEVEEHLSPSTIINLFN